MQQSNTCQGGLDSAWETLPSYLKWKKEYDVVQHKDYKLLAPFPQGTASSPKLPVNPLLYLCPSRFPSDLEELSLHPALRGAGFIGKLFLLSACKGQGCCVSSCDSLLNSLPAPCRPCLTQIFKPAQWQHYHENSHREVREVLLN